MKEGGIRDDYWRRLLSGGLEAQSQAIHEAKQSFRDNIYFCSARNSDTTELHVHLLFSLAPYAAPRPYPRASAPKTFSRRDTDRRRVPR